MTEIQEAQTECSQADRINSFLANRLSPDGRRDLVAHLGTCEPCASLLRDLRKDERLARLPLTAEERESIQVIVQEARQEVGKRLESARRQREAIAEPVPQPQLAPPRLAVPATHLRRVLWLAAAAAAALAAAGWWFFANVA